MTSGETTGTSTPTASGKAKRRGHNEGSIQHRADGRWEARVSLPGGKRKAL